MSAKKAKKAPPRPKDRLTKERPTPSRRPTDRPVQVDVTVDRALKRAWEAALAELREASRAEARDWDRRYEAIGRILTHDPPLYLAGGMATAKAFIAKHVGENERQVWRWVRVAKHASPDEEAKYGVSKLDAILTLLAARAGDVEGRLPVDFAKVRLTVTRDGKAVRLGLEDLSVDEIRRAATDEARAKAKSATASAELRAVDAALRAAGLRAKLRLAKGQLWFGAVPLASLKAFARALLAVRLPG